MLYFELLPQEINILISSRLKNLDLITLFELSPFNIIFKSVEFWKEWILINTNNPLMVIEGFDIMAYILLERVDTNEYQ